MCVHSPFPKYIFIDGIHALIHRHIRSNFARRTRAFSCWGRCDSLSLERRTDVSCYRIILKYPALDQRAGQASTDISRNFFPVFLIHYHKGDRCLFSHRHVACFENIKNKPSLHVWTRLLNKSKDFSSPLNVSLFYSSAITTNRSTTAVAATAPTASSNKVRPNRLPSRARPHSLTTTFHRTGRGRLYPVGRALKSLRR